MPITPYEDMVFGAFTYPNNCNPLTNGEPVLDAEVVTLRAFRTTEHRDGGIVSVQPKLLVSGDGGRSYATGGVLPNTGSIVTSGLAPDQWHSGPWAWLIDPASPNFRDRTHLRIALQLVGEEFGFCRGQLEYSVRRRLVARVPCFRRVIANGDGPGRWRLTEPIRPHVENGYLRATIAVHALNQMSGTGTVRPIWFYNRSPGDANDWTFGGYLHDAVLTGAGTYTTVPVAVNGLTDNLLVAFGFEVARSGGTVGHTAFAHVEGTFALY